MAWGLVGLAQVVAVPPQALWAQADQAERRWRTLPGRFLEKRTKRMRATRFRSLAEQRVEPLRVAVVEVLEN
jgi:hypothetical protein